MKQLIDFFAKFPGDLGVVWPNGHIICSKFAHLQHWKLPNGLKIVKIGWTFCQILYNH